VGKCGENPARCASVKLSAGAEHTLAVDATGVAWAWGRNDYSQLADGDGNSVPLSQAPWELKTTVGFMAIAGGERHSVALKADGKVWAWGRNLEGQLGLGMATGPAIQVPTATMGLATDVAAVAAGALHTVALTTDGSVWTWGKNDFGQLGDGTKANSGVPRKVTSVLAGKTVTAVAAGNFHTIALTSDGELYAWGGGTAGQLGNNASQNSLVPVLVVGQQKWSAVVTGGDTNLALDVSSKLYGWGYNGAGQVGDGTTDARIQPTYIMDNVIAMASGGNHCLALKSDGTVWAWGSNAHGQLGNGTTNPDPNPNLKPAQVKTLSGVLAIAAGAGHSVALTSDGTVWAWGDNDWGQVGSGDLMVEAYHPAQVADFNPFVPCGVPACDVASQKCSVLGPFCVAADECHAPGACEKPTGVCTNPVIADGQPCAADTGTCQSGVCATPSVASAVVASSSSGSVGGSSSSGSTGGAGPEGTIDYSCGIGLASGSPSPRAAWLGVIALLALRRRRAHLRRTTPQSL
jgi:alpha-tubulin suppressor-like RCC1 family protein